MRLSESDVKLLIRAERLLEKSKFTTNFSMAVFQVYSCSIQRQKWLVEHLLKKTDRPTGNKWSDGPTLLVEHPPRFLNVVVCGICTAIVTNNCCE